MDGGAYIGGVGLDQFSPPDKRARIEYRLGRPFRGKGYATEAASRVCEIAFGTLGFHRIETGVVAPNLASSAVLERLGFRLEGRARDRTRIDGKWEDDLLYGLVQPDFRRFNPQGQAPAGPRS